jgi:peptidoglycan/xylan/chitin deacetylase (PgdA/CDA1 family)
VSSYRPAKTTLPTLPLLLWETPPGLELALAQEGIAFRAIREPHPLAFQTGRFVLYDGRRVAPSAVRARLSAEQVGIDIDALRVGEPVDPFQALVDTRSALTRWELGGHVLTERVSRYPKAAVRRRLLEPLRRAVTAAGGLWARLAPYPFPYRSAFSFRADLDETNVDDYARFARARHRLADCCTHFVSTAAYGEQAAVLQDLLRFDTQSHGHHHVVYRDAGANRRNLARAHELLCESGFEPIGFAAPHGRWNLGLDQVLEDLGYLYSSDFQLGYDDLPFFPWCGDRFSRVLQVPIHPVCEGLFFDAGETRGRVVAEHLARVVRERIDAGEPAFVYGHPERRLGRYPEVLAAIDAAVAGEPLLWRVTLTEFALWWRWRDERRWSVVPRADGRFEVQLEDWCGQFPLALEVVRGRHVAAVPLLGPLTPLRLEELAYELRPEPPSWPEPGLASRPLSLKAAVREALDWETVTPLEELPADTLTARVKKGLRWWKESQNEGVGR